MSLSNVCRGSDPSSPPSLVTTDATRDPIRLTASLKHLTKLGITCEATSRKYGRIYAHDKYLKILNEGTEPLN
jgi:hypothetical protein